LNTTELHLQQATSVPHQRGIKVEQSIIINKPPEELYRFWRNLENLPRFMSQHVTVQQTNGGKRSHWIVKSVADSTFEWDAEIVNDIPNEVFAWRSLAGADLDHAGSVHFKELSHGEERTELKLVLEYRPPVGKLSVGLAKLFGQEPAQVIAKDLHRLKQLMETGAIHSAEEPPTATALRAWPEDSQIEAPTTDETKLSSPNSLSEEMLDKTLADSFPSSDPPSWTTGREHAPRPTKK
jgi:uncharacterized membrane protein